MDAQATPEVLRHFHAMTDPRRHNRVHRLTDLLTIALFAVLSGAEGWADVAEYGRRKLAWLRTFLPLPRGIPSHDTFGRVFARLIPAEFERCFMAWMASLVELAGGRLVAIDGKSLRRSFEHGWDKSGMAHMVSAFVEANRLVFAQVACDGKGRELDAIGRLLALLDLNGAVVSIDAIACNAGVARQVLDAGGRYVLQVKENQPTLHAKLQMTLDEAIRDGFAGLSHDGHAQTDGDHGRIETRELWVTWDVAEVLGHDLAKQWPGLKSLAVVQRTRQQVGQATASIERHYYLTALDRRTTAAKLAAYIRGHWSVENNLHWQLDVSFNEDQRRIRKGHGAENFSRLCRIALNLLKAERTATLGIAGKRKCCAWDNDYLLKVLGQ
jgi:predicted transposase YbfD/YdcC